MELATRKRRKPQDSLMEERNKQGEYHAPCGHSRCGGDSGCRRHRRLLLEGFTLMVLSQGPGG